MLDLSEMAARQEQLMSRKKRKNRFFRKSSPEHFIKLETIVRETFNSSETSFENLENV